MATYSKMPHAADGGLIGEAELIEVIERSLKAHGPHSVMRCLLDAFMVRADRFRDVEGRLDEYERLIIARSILGETADRLRTLIGEDH